MPLYGFKCVACDHEFESIEPVNMKNMAECPACKQLAGSKLISAVGGYYIRGNNSASVRPKGAGAFKGRKSAKT